MLYGPCTLHVSVAPESPRLTALASDASTRKELSLLDRGLQPMCADRQQPAGSPGPCRGKDKGRGRIGSWLCLFAFALHSLLPMLHVWEGAARPVVLAFPAAGEASLLDSVPPPALFLARSTDQQRVPHDAASCAVCRVLTHHRAWIVPQVWTTCRPATVLAFLRLPVCRPVTLLCHAIAARAPPTAAVSS